MLWQTLCITFALAFLWKLLVALQETIRTRSVLKKLPCPPGAHWLYGHQKLGPFDPGFQWLLDTVKAFPRVFTLWQGPIPLPVLVHPDTIKPLLTGKVASRKSVLYKLFADWIGEGLVTSDGAKWKRNRRLLTHSFHLDVLRTYIPVFNDCVDVLMGKMDRLAAQRKPMDINRELVLCTFDVILRTAFSNESNCQLQELPNEDGIDVLSASDNMSWTFQERQFRNQLLINPLVFWLSPHYSKYKKAYMYLRNTAKRLIEQRVREIAKQADAGDPITKPRDFLDSLVLARDADGSGLSVNEMVDEVNTFMFAGHETTSTSMTWLLYFLAKHSEHQTKIREEVDEILGNRDSERISFKDISRLEYMSIVMKESMRMVNAAVMISRTVEVPYDVDGVTLPVGTMVGISIYQLHHNPAVWGDDHMEFKPSRFLPENFSKMDPFSFIPFSAGARNCIGQQFALNEMKVFIARILRRFRLSLVKGEPEPVPAMNGVLKPEHPVFINLEPIDRNS